MLATTAGLPPDDGAWAYEMKWDGLRAIAEIDHGRLQLWSRTGRDITAGYPELQQLAAAAGVDQAVLDGEIVVFGAEGWPSFEALQQRMNISAAGPGPGARWPRCPSPTWRSTCCSWTASRCWISRTPSAARCWSSWS